MRLSVATNFDPALVDALRGFPVVEREEMGADGIVLDSLLVNREFSTPARIREAVECDLELLMSRRVFASSRPGTGCGRSSGNKGSGCAPTGASSSESRGC